MCQWAEIMYRKRHEEYNDLPEYEGTMIVTIDKDLDMVPGYHYNWLKQERYFVTEEEGMRNFYIQVLTGDGVDNIQGLKGVGPVGAKKILDPYMTVTEFYKAALEAYENQYGKDGAKELEKAARLLWMSKGQPNDWSKP